MSSATVLSPSILLRRPIAAFPAQTMHACHLASSILAQQLLQKAHICLQGQGTSVCKSFPSPPQDAGGFTPWLLPIHFHKGDGISKEFRVTWQQEAAGKRCCPWQCKKSSGRPVKIVLPLSGDAMCQRPTWGQGHEEGKQTSLGLFFWHPFSTSWMKT